MGEYQDNLKWTTTCSDHMPSKLTTHFWGKPGHYGKGPFTKILESVMSYTSLGLQKIS